MWLLSRPSTGVGLDVGIDAVRAVVLRRPRTQWAVVAAGSAPLPPSSGFAAADGDPTIASAVTAELMQRLHVRKALVAVAISARDAVIRRLILPRSSRKALAAAVRAAAAEDIPFAADDADVTWTMPTAPVDDAEHLEVLAVAVRRSAVQDRTAVVAQAGHVPAVVDVEALALANAHELNYPDQIAETTVLVNIGRVLATVCFVRQGALVGVSDALVAHANLPDVGLVVARAVQAYRAKDPAFARPSRVLLTGDACQTRGLVERIADELGVEVEFFDPFRRVARAPGVDPSAAGPSFAIAIGLAMRRQGDS
jgi:type IV pilus assembly protein PilM